MQQWAGSAMRRYTSESEDYSDVSEQGEPDEREAFGWCTGPAERLEWLRTALRRRGVPPCADLALPAAVEPCALPWVPQSHSRPLLCSRRRSDPRAQPPQGSPRAC